MAQGLSVDKGRTVRDKKSPPDPRGGLICNRGERLKGLKASAHLWTSRKIPWPVQEETKQG